MTAKTAKEETLAAVLIGRWEQVGRKLATLAEAFPEDRYESAPAEGVRTVGDVLRHVAFWNQYVADSANGRKVDDSLNELPKADYATKARVVKALNRASADAASAIQSHAGKMDAKTAEMIVSFIEHTSEHYGQLVVYARLNGIVPPASR